GWDQVAENSAHLPDRQTSGLRNQAVMRYAKGDPAALGQPLYALDEKLRAGTITQAQHQAQRTQVFNQHSSNPAAMESAYRDIDVQRSSRNSEREQNLAKNKQVDTARAWSRYESRLDQAALSAFKTKWDSLLSQADKVIDRRTQALVSWLE